MPAYLSVRCTIKLFQDLINYLLYLQSHKTNNDSSQGYIELAETVSILVSLKDNIQCNSFVLPLIIILLIAFPSLIL